MGYIESDRAEPDSRYKLAAVTMPSMHVLQVAVQGIVPALRMRPGACVCTRAMCDDMTMC